MSDGASVYYSKLQSSVQCSVSVTLHPDWGEASGGQWPFLQSIVRVVRLGRAAEAAASLGVEAV